MKTPGQVMYEAYMRRWSELQLPKLHDGYVLLPNCPWEDLGEEQQSCWNTAAAVFLESMVVK